MSQSSQTAWTPVRPLQGQEQDEVYFTELRALKAQSNFPCGASRAAANERIRRLQACLDQLSSDEIVEILLRQASSSDDLTEKMISWFSTSSFEQSKSMTRESSSALEPPREQDPDEAQMNTPHLKDFLRSPINCSRFYSFLERNHSQESLLMYKAIEEFRRNHHERDAVSNTKLAISLYNEYISDTSSNQVNITHHTRQPLDKWISQFSPATASATVTTSPPITLYDAVQNELLTLMTEDSFLKFCCAAEFKDALSFNKRVRTISQGPATNRTMHTLGISSRYWKILDSVSRTHILQPGEALAKVGEESPFIYRLDSGTLSIRVHLASTNRIFRQQPQHSPSPFATSAASTTSVESSYSDHSCLSPDTVDDALFNPLNRSEKQFLVSILQKPGSVFGWCTLFRFGLLSPVSYINESDKPVKVSLYPAAFILYLAKVDRMFGMLLFTEIGGVLSKIYCETHRLLQDRNKRFSFFVSTNLPLITKEIVPNQNKEAEMTNDDAPPRSFIDAFPALSNSLIIKQFEVTLVSNEKPATLTITTSNVCLSSPPYAECIPLSDASLVPKRRQTPQITVKGLRRKKIKCTLKSIEIRNLLFSLLQQLLDSAKARSVDSGTAVPAPEIGLLGAGDSCAQLAQNSFQLLPQEWEIILNQQRYYQPNSQAQGADKYIALGRVKYFKGDEILPYKDKRQIMVYVLEGNCDCLVPSGPESATNTSKQLVYTARPGNILGVSGFFAENSFQGIPYSISAETNLVEVALLNNRTLQKKLFWRYPDIAVKFLHTLCSELEEQLRSSFLDNIL